MASIVDICNMALSHIGSDAVVVNISPPDGSVEAGHCARFYPIAREELLENHHWTFAKRRSALTQATNTSEVWSYAYALPSDCVRPNRVLQRSVLQDFVNWPFTGVVTADELQLWTERGSADFEIENGVLFTHEEEAVLLYTVDVTDTSKFTASFTVALSYQLAAYLAGPIIKGLPGAKTAGELRQIAAAVIGEAKVKDANSSSERSEHVPDDIRVRS